MANVKRLTVKGRGSYVQVDEPQAINGGEPKYSLCVIINKSDKETIAKLNNVIDDCIEEGKSTKFGGKTTGVKRFLRDGDIDKPDDPNYKDSMFFNCSSKNKPPIVDRKREYINEPGFIYSGCYVNVSITPFSYSVNGSRGVSCALNALQKVAEGKPLGSRIDVNAEFDSLEDEEFLD